MDKTLKVFLYFLMIAISVFLFNHILTGRYEVIPTGADSFSYKLDKWTGKTTAIYDWHQMDVIYKQPVE